MSESQLLLSLFCVGSPSSPLGGPSVPSEILSPFFWMTFTGTAVCSPLLLRSGFIMPLDELQNLKIRTRFLEKSQLLRVGVDGSG